MKYTYKQPLSVMGFDIDRFVSPVNEGLLCCICRDVLEDPVQAASCEHAYCRSCIHGWLVQEHKCPEDRTPLHMADLRPLFRYMKNDLESLQIRCRNHGAGCSEVFSLEHVRRHEDEDCQYFSQQCPMTGCNQYVGRGELQHHLEQCEFRTEECPKGCGLPLLSRDDRSHNCILELRTTLEILRAEMICKVQETRQELELRLDAQRRHMLHRENYFRGQVDELKLQTTQALQEVAALKEAELRRQEEQALDSENKLMICSGQARKLCHQCSHHSDKSLL